MKLTSRAYRAEQQPSRASYELDFVTISFYRQTMTELFREGRQRSSGAGLSMGLMIGGGTPFNRKTNLQPPHW